MNGELKVTSLTELSNQAKGALVKLPPFAEGGEFVARLRRPSMLSLVRAQKIPNSLLTSANKMFANGPGTLDTSNESMLDDIFKIMDVICEAAFVEPTYSEIRKAGIELTDDQIMFVFGYTQNGVKQLESFRTE